METILNNLDEIFTAIGMIVTAASIIVKLTPTTKDDEVLGKVIKFIEFFSIFNRKKAA